ncbi:MAG: hypothetical protein QW590_01505 [Candidatus Bilamarchaeaceae archaeon]
MTAVSSQTITQKVVCANRQSKYALRFIHEEKTEKIRRPQIFIVYGPLTERINNCKQAGKQVDADREYIKNLGKKLGITV